MRVGALGWVPRYISAMLPGLITFTLACTSQSTDTAAPSGTAGSTAISGTATSTGTSTPSGTATLSCPADTLDPGQVEVLAAGFERDGTAGTEGVAFSPDGRLFVGGSAVGGGGFVAEVWPDGSWAELAAVPGSVGLAWWEGGLVVASGDGDGSVVAVDVDSGGTTTVAGGIPSANFPAGTPWGSLLVATHTANAIYEVTADGQVAVWADDLPTPNGLVFDPAGAWLYVANTYGVPSEFGRIPVSDGAAGSWETLAVLDDGATQDGVAIDAAGDIYVALNLPGQIARITPEGDQEIIAEGVDWAASIAFGRGDDWDPCSLYATSLFSDALYRVGVGVPGGALFE